MSTVLLSRPTVIPTAPVVRPRRRPAARRGPVARPARVAPSVRTAGSALPVQACRVDGPTSSAAWRLTDRGVAVVLVLATMIVIAALTVVGLTAWRVTGADSGDGAVASVSSR